MARLNSSVMWFLPAVMLWMCVDVEVKATTKVCRLKCSDDRYNSLWTPFNNSLWNLYNEVKGSRAGSLNESDIYKNCTDLRGSRKKMQQYNHLGKFMAALVFVRNNYGDWFINHTNLTYWTLTDLINSSIWTPDSCTATIKANLRKSCKTSLKLEASKADDYKKEVLENLVEMAMGTKTGRNRCPYRRRNKKPRKQQQQNQKKN